MDLALGSVAVVTPGTPVQVTKNLTNPTFRSGCQAILFQVLKGNVGVVYVGKKGMVRATGVGVQLQLPAPISSVTGPFTSGSIGIPLAAAGLDASSYFVDADNGGDGVLVTLVTQ